MYKRQDGVNLSVPGADPDAIQFGFNVWTVLDEVMNPNVEYDQEKGGLIVEKAFAGQETFLMPDGVGENTLVKVCLLYTSSVSGRTERLQDGI